MGPRLDSRGRLTPAAAYRLLDEASMGPRLDSRGRPGRDADGDCRVQGFNGAAAGQPRKAQAFG